MIRAVRATILGAMGALLLADFFDEWLGWLVAGLLPEVRAHFQIDYVQAGWALTAHLLGGYAGSVAGGIVADLWSRRGLLLLGARLLRLALALALLDGLDEPFAGFVMLFLRDVAGTSVALSNAVVAVLVGSGLAGFALATRFTGPRGRAMSTSLMALTAGLVGFLLVPGVLWKTACLAIVGLSSAGFYTVALAEALSLRPDTTGTTTSVLSVVGAVSLLFPPLTGAIADAHGLPAAMLFYAGLPVLMLGLVGELHDFLRFDSPQP